MTSAVRCHLKPSASPLRARGVGRAERGGDMSEGAAATPGEVEMGFDTPGRLSGAGRVGLARGVRLDVVGELGAVGARAEGFEDEGLVLGAVGDAQGFQQRRCIAELESGAFVGERHAGSDGL